MELIACISTVDNVIRAIDSDSAKKAEPYRYRCVCDVCNQSRHRKMIYVIKDGGKEICAGRNCLVSLFSKEQIEEIESASTTEDFSTHDEVMKFGRSPRADYSETRFFLKSVYAIIKQYGYCSSSTAWESGRRSTKMDYFDFVSGKLECDVNVDDSVVDEIINFGKSSSGNDFSGNFNAIANSDVIDDKSVGIGAWLVRAYINSKTDSELTASRTDRFGIEGKRVKESTIVKCLQVMNVVDNFNGGLKELSYFKTEDGSILCWTGSHNTEEGKKYNLSAFTPKEFFKSKRGFCATKINRVICCPA